MAIAALVVFLQLGSESGRGKMDGAVVSTAASESNQSSWASNVRLVCGRTMRPSVT